MVTEGHKHAHTYTTTRACTHKQITFAYRMKRRRVFSGIVGLDSIKVELQEQAANMAQLYCIKAVLSRI